MGSGRVWYKRGFPVAWEPSCASGREAGMWVPTRGGTSMSWKGGQGTGSHRGSACPPPQALTRFPGSGDNPRSFVTPSGPRHPR